MTCSGQPVPFSGECPLANLRIPKVSERVFPLLKFRKFPSLTLGLGTAGISSPPGCGIQQFSDITGPCAINTGRNKG